MPRPPSQTADFHTLTRRNPLRTERDTLASLSSHQANTPVMPSRQCTKRPALCRDCLSYASASSCFQLFRPYDRLTRSLCSSPITGPSSLLLIGPPQCSASVLSPRGFRRLCFSLAIRALVPAVPRESQRPIHAPSTPVAVCPVIRHPTDFSQKRFMPLVLATLDFFTTHRRRVCFRSSLGRSPARSHAPSFCSNAHDRGF